MAKKQPVKDGPNLFKVSETAWFYYERDGLLVINECRAENGTYHKTMQFKIRWKLLDAALACRPKKKRKARSPA